MARIKEHIGTKLQEILGLSLSEEKTSITDIRKNAAKFLGFKLKNNQKHAPITIKYREKKPYKSRITFSTLFIGPEHDRITSRMLIKGFIKKENNRIIPKEYTLFTQLKDHEIVLRYRQIIEGLTNYYIKNITFKSSLSRYHYYLTYSCYKTLAYRKKTSIRNIIKKYGPKLNMTYKTFRKNKIGEIIEKKQQTSLPGYQESIRTSIKRLITEAKEKPTDFLSIKVNLRTMFKINKYCCICGTTGSKENRIEAHHIKHVHKGKLTGFSEIMRSLNKRQIICCRTCHTRIHKGLYNGTRLIDFYDPVLAEF